jgi:hypothetical protein
MYSVPATVEPMMVVTIVLVVVTWVSVKEVDPVNVATVELVPTNSVMVDRVHDVM